MRVLYALALWIVFVAVSAAMGGEISFANSTDGARMQGDLTNLSFGTAIPGGYSAAPNANGAYCTTGYSRYARAVSSEGTMALTAGGSSDTAMVSVLFANTTATSAAANTGTSVGIVDAAGSATIYSTNSLKVAFVNSGTSARYGRLMYSTTSTSSYIDFSGRGSSNDITLESGKWYQLVGYFRKTSTAGTWKLTVRLINVTDNVVIDQVTQDGVIHTGTYNAASLLAGLSWNRSSAQYTERFLWAVEQCFHASGGVSFASSTDGSKLAGSLSNITFGDIAGGSGYSTPPNPTGAACATGYNRYGRVISSEGTLKLTPQSRYDTAKVSAIFANTTTGSSVTNMGTSVGVCSASWNGYNGAAIAVAFVNDSLTARNGRLMYSVTGSEPGHYVDFIGRSAASNITLESGKWYKLIGYFQKTAVDNVWNVTAMLWNHTDNICVDMVSISGLINADAYDAASVAAGLSWNRSSARFMENLEWSLEQSPYSSDYAEIVVDTDFTDWDSIPPMYDALYDGLAISRGLTEAKLANDDSSLYYQIRTLGEFGDDPTTGDTAFLYIDIDNNPATGTLVGPAGQQVGAEYTVYSWRRFNASMGNGVVAQGAYVPGGALVAVDTFTCNGGLAPWDIADGVHSLEGRILLDAIGLSRGATIAYTVGVSRSSGTMDWLDTKRTYRIARETFAVNAAPESGAKCAAGTTRLSWDAPLDVSGPSYRVYLGASYDSVAVAHTGSPEYKTATGDTYYDAALNANTQYYWRIDVVDGSQVYKGTIWNFTTAIPAFPGAEGAGMWSSGGRGGDVYHVTNLNDTGAGSLRYGIENATGPRTIVFDVSGTIELESNLTIDTSHMTIAGQTAPGEGITLKKRRFCISKGDVIVRYLRSRPGDLIGPCADAEWIDCVAVWGRYGGTLRNVMVDHFSGAWSVGKSMNVIGTVTDCTIQNSTAFESLYNSVNPDGPHSMGFLYRPNVNSRMSSHHNVFAHNNARNPRPGSYDGYTALLDFRNNAVFNYGGQIAGYSGTWADGEDILMNYVGNYVIAGSQSTGAYVFKGFDIEHTLIYQSSNYMDGNKNGSFDGTDGGWSVFYSPTYQYFTKSDTEMAVPHAPVTTQTAANALSGDLQSSGCTIPSRDPVDTRVIESIYAGTGRVIDSQTEVGGWPTLYSLTAFTDTDQDGMPDYWESQYSLNSSSATDRNADNDGDGYTNLEEYLNNTDPVNNGGPIVYIIVSDSRADEENGSNTGKFVVSRTGSTSSALTVNLSISGTATNGTDYSTISSSVVIPSGASSAVITISPVNDASAEGDEQVIVGISTSANYKMGLPKQALVVVQDGD